jgi:hypothetical protein
MTLTEKQMRHALRLLNDKLRHPVRLIVGGGGAMILAHHFSLVTSDIDAVPASGTTALELDPLVKQVANEQGLPKDWLNPYYSTFTHVLPADYGSRLENVLALDRLSVDALSLDDLLIMKCFAGRMKDRVHARALIQNGARVRFVEQHLESLRDRKIPGAEQAIDFLDEVLDTVEPGR